MLILTPKEMGELDKKVIDSGFESLLLMETAGRKTAEIIKEKYNKDNNILILAGSGNNGGDGLVIARILDICDYNVKIIIVGNYNKLKEDPLTNYKICKLRDIELDFFDKQSDFSLIKDSISKSDLIIDSMLGTGLTGDLRDPYLQIVKLINKSNNEVLAVDIPTGIDGFNGRVMKEAVEADITVTMAFSKIGHLLYPGRAYTGQLNIVDLGFPEKLIDHKKYRHHSLTLKEANKLLPKRERTGHKGCFGKVLVIGGSFGLEGAVALTGNSALKTGSGLAKLLAPEAVNATIKSFCQEAISERLTIKNIKENIENYDIIALGPGLGRGKFQKEVVSFLLNNANKPLIIDADGLNNLKLEELKRAEREILLTPHPGEFARLVDKSVDEIQSNRIKYLRDFTQEYNVNVVLKGASSLIADQKGNVYINTTGNEGMATAGSGDVLTGIIASLAGQKVNLYQSAVLGVYLHGLAGDIACSKVGSHSLMAQDIITNIPPAISKIKRGC